MKLHYFLILFFFIGARADELRWNWNLLETKNIFFKPDFLWGVAISEHQVSGSGHCVASNWAVWERKLQHQSGKACNHWDSHDETIDCLKILGVKAFRFSVDWSLIEPCKGAFDVTALNKYKVFCAKLKAAGIAPVVTLHHFTHPQWFEEEGAFEYERNIYYFVRFCEHIFDALREDVTLWCTINEPGVYVFQAYVRGVYPPGKTNFIKAGAVLHNLCKAHVAVHSLFHQKTTSSDLKVGIVHNILQFEPFHKNNIIESFVCSYLNMILNDAVLGFFKDGVFKFSIASYIAQWNKLLRNTRPFSSGIKIFEPLVELFSPIPVHIDEKHSKATTSLDFIGLNYYSHVLWNWRQPSGESYREEAIKTDMPYALYPEGLYRAIQRVAELEVPIYITENGIADARDDRRSLWIERYIFALHRAIEEGYDVRGFFYWSLMDNFEWDEGFTKKFGLFEVDFVSGKKRLRAGAQPFIDIIRRTYKTIDR